ncbi:SCP2 sterol-binding domain-containing protein [Mycena pura]|uniref:SCP2 sterol-binding domain-containing protein n=1 Tax=Mycena pura TaxID=153505 RepID=A0AAD6YRA9_9AGAR|nr:SCP2 sterol-binding domain-containing protein [Mycena pura]
MSDDLKVDGFRSSELIYAIGKQLETASDKEKSDQMKKVNGVIQFQVTNDAKDTTHWTIDLKKTCTVYKGEAKPKADVTIILSDDTLVDLAAGKINGQKAFMTGKLKTKGNMMLATKLDSVLKAAAPGGKAKL